MSEHSTINDFVVLSKIGKTNFFLMNFHNNITYRIGGILRSVQSKKKVRLIRICS